MKNIILCGFMGCGKTTIALRLADQLQRPYIDTDAAVVERAGKSIREIFEQEGEAQFRLLEQQAAAALSKQGGCIIATGGGTVLNAATAQLLREGGTIFFLDVPEAELQRRLARVTNRPLLNRPDRSAFITRLLAVRRPLYLAAADVVIDCAGKSPDAVCAAILQHCPQE